MSYDRLSKYLSLILRHHPEVIGISLDAHGWADVDELIAGIAQKKKFNREILEEIVRTDKKNENPGKPGAFYSGRSGASADRTAGRTLARHGGKICRFY